MLADEESILPLAHQVLFRKSAQLYPVDERCHRRSAIAVWRRSSSGIVCGSPGRRILPEGPIRSSVGFKMRLRLPEALVDFVLISDLDWCSGCCAENFLSIAGLFSIQPTIFVTHRSAAIPVQRAAAASKWVSNPFFLRGHLTATASTGSSNTFSNSSERHCHLMPSSFHQSRYLVQPLQKSGARSQARSSKPTVAASGFLRGRQNRAS